MPGASECESRCRGSGASVTLRRPAPTRCSSVSHCGGPCVRASTISSPLIAVLSYDTEYERSPAATEQLHIACDDTTRR